MTITTNQPPYRDDYNESKDFHRILYRPGFPVQARELTQQQTILQNQIERFGKHIFDEGSLVTGGQFDIDVNFPYILLTQENSVGNQVDPLSFEGKTVEGQTSGVQAKIIRVQEISYQGTTYFSAFIRYSSGSETTEVVEFIPNEVIEDVDNTVNNIRLQQELFGPVPVIGKGSLFTIEEGVVFSQGMFINFARQSIILDAFSQSPTCRIGFDIRINTVSSADDESLLDNANGTPNFNAPGADRLKITATLQRIDIDDTAGLPSFVELFTIREGVIQRKFSTSQYAIIGDEIARRTFDESGDYNVRGHTIRTREHLDTGVNEGFLTAENGGDPNLLAIDIEPGLSYVKGYEINTLVTEHISTDKSTDFEYVNSQVISARSSNYVVVEEIVGIPVLDKGTLVDLYCSGGASPDEGEKRITNVIPSSTTPSGQKIGTARVKSVIYESGILGTASGRLRIYLYDIQMNGDCGGFPNVRTIHCSSPVDFFADVVLNSITNEAELSQKFFQPLIYPIGTSFTRSIRSENDLSDTTFTFQRTNDNIIIGNDGTFNITIGTALEQFAYGEGLLSSIEKQNIFVTLEEDAEITLSGTVSGTSGGTTLTGSSTSFTNLNVGDKLEITDVSGTYIISSITSNTELEVDRSFSSTFSTKTIKKVYYTGDYINLNLKGSDSGVTRTASIDVSRRNLAVDIKESFDGGATPDATISYQATRSGAFETKKQLRSNRFVKIDCSTISSSSPADLTVPINLGISDVFRITQIRKDTSAFTTDTQGVDVTEDFIFNNGQTDDFYDHASIQLKFGASLTTSDYLLVKLDYFEPDFTQGVGYFSVDSYPIDDTQVTDTTIFTHEIPVYRSVQTGQEYDLKDMLDFRSVKENTAANAVSVASATTNPTSSTSFVQPTNGLRIAVPSSRIFIDYSYYLARRDVVVVNSNGAFRIIKGNSSTFPLTPEISEDVSALVELYIPPYPSISETYARILDRLDISVRQRDLTNERFTMRDIGVLKNRINNLEYYTSLSLLEKQVEDLVIPDEEGLNRFKNGYFIDAFEDHSLGDTSNPDYNVSIDSIELCIRPSFEVDSFLYEYLPNQSSEVQIGKTLITLPYEEVPLIEQLKATTIRNIEQAVFRYIGTVELDPEDDIWVDTETYDKRIVQDLRRGRRGSSTSYGSWQTKVSGYSVYKQAGGWTGKLFRDGALNDTSVRVGSFSNASQAQNAARSLATYGGYGRQFGQHTQGAVAQDVVRTRQVVKTSVQTKTSTKYVGTFLVDTKVIPYIRPQVIQVYAKGLKANTRFHVFFDDENMNDLIAPAIIPDGWDGDMTGNFTYQSYGTILKSDAYGDVVFNLKLPKEGKRFRTGTKEVKITDSPTNAIDATSYAEGYFVAQGTLQIKQRTFLTTKYTVVKTRVVNQQVRTRQSVRVVGPSCMAYSFLVNAPEGEDGVFMTSVDVWIQSIDDANELGVWFEIREMDSGGDITRTQVPYSEVWMKYGDPRIKTSEDASEYTRVNFDNPVFLQNDTQYAFVIHTEGLNPNTYFFISRLGETDIATGQQVTGRQLTGTVFATNNNLNWDIVPDIDLKVRFNRAKFQTGAGEAILGNTPHEFFTIQDRSDIFNDYGETITGSEKLTLTNIAGSNTIVIGDEINGVSSGESANIVEISSNTYYTDGTGFQSGESITVTGKDTTGDISNISAGSGTLIDFNRIENKMVLSKSNGHFFDGCMIVGQDSSVTAEIFSVDDFKYSTVYFNPNNIQFANTNIDYQVRQIDTASGLMDSYQNILSKTDQYFTTQKSLLSRSNELERNIVSGRSAQVKCELSSTSEWVSPIIDMNRSSSVYVYNVINDDITGETNPNGGSLKNKYISKVTTLAEGQDAEDLIVSLTAYAPFNITTEDYPVKVWAKIRNNQDEDPFESKEWIEMELADDPVFSSTENQDDYKAVDFKFPDSMFSDNELNPGVQYTSNGNTFTGFKQFSIKIGLLGNEQDTAIVPKVGDLRVIALQM